MKDSVLHIKIFMGWFEVTFPPLWGKVEWCFVYTPPETLLLGFPGGSDSKESACNVGDLGSVSGLGRSPEGGRGKPLQYSCLENPMDRGAWRAIVHGVTKSWTRLSN